MSTYYVLDTELSTGDTQIKSFPSGIPQKPPGEDSKPDTLLQSGMTQVEMCSGITRATGRNISHTQKSTGRQNPELSRKSTDGGRTDSSCQNEEGEVVAQHFNGLDGSQGLRCLVRKSQFQKVTRYMILFI